MKELSKKIVLKALDASNPSKLIEDCVSVHTNRITIYGDEWEITNRADIYIIAIGKAAPEMSGTLKDLLSVDVANVLGISPHSEDKKPDYCVYASHPTPDKKSREAAEKLLQFINDIPSESMILFALSGGASSLVCKPAEGLKLKHINQVNKLLLESGATIGEINSIRKHMSAIKGGQLLSYFKQDCTLIDLVISDVPGDDLEIIGSGPTTTDASTFEDAHSVLLKYDLWKTIPEAAKVHIQKGLNGEAPETPGPGEDPIENHHSFIIGSAKKFAEEVAGEAEKKGFKTWIADEPYTESVAEVAGMISQKIEDCIEQNDGPYALIFYGESTVKVTGSGKGGRNQELALHGAIHIAGMENVSWLSAGTDGIDGPTDAAGAVVDGKTIEHAKNKGLKAAEFLKKNDSYHFHQQMGTLIKTGPTGNNMMDIVLITIG